MHITQAIKESQKKRDLFNQDVYVLKDNDGKYFSVLNSNLNIFLHWEELLDKSIHYTAWNMKK